MGLERSQSNKQTNLEKLPIKIPRLATPEEREVKENSVFNIIFNGIPLTINVSFVSEFEKKKGNMPLIEVSIKIYTEPAKEDYSAGISISINKDEKGYCKATTVVANKERGLKGLGRVLWEMSLNLIQRFADKLGVPVNHKVSKMPRHGLTDKKWNELFLPLLQQHGYEQDYPNPSLWWKTYSPEKK